MVPEVSLAKSSLRSGIFGKKVTEARPCSPGILSGREGFDVACN